MLASLPLGLLERIVRLMINEQIQIVSHISSSS
jgi:hypothetical protein